MVVMKDLKITDIDKWVAPDLFDIFVSPDGKVYEIVDETHEVIAGVMIDEGIIKVEDEDNMLDLGWVRVGLSVALTPEETFYIEFKYDSSIKYVDKIVDKIINWDMDDLVIEQCEKLFTGSPKQWLKYHFNEMSLVQQFH